MKTFLILLRLRRAGYEFNRDLETERNYVLTKGFDNISVPKRPELDKFVAAEILRHAGLLLMILMLAGLSSLAEPAESADPRSSPASTRYWQQ
jgi:hypothetical protein